MVDLTISIVNINNCSLLEGCLKSIFEKTHKTNLEVFVVDNASEDGSPQMVKEKFPQVRLIENDINRGFATANNQVINESESKYVLLLNNDTLVLPNALDKMVEFMDKHEDAGALGCKLLNPDGSLQFSLRTFPTIVTSFFESSFFQNLFLVNCFAKKYKLANWDYNSIREVDQPMGSCLMLRREVFSRIGLLDENLFLFFEDVDLCLRIKKAGWKIYYLPDAKIIHYGGQSITKSKLELSLQWHKSKYYFFRKHHGKFTLLKLKILNIFILTINLLILAIKDKKRVSEKWKTYLKILKL